MASEKTRTARNLKYIQFTCCKPWRVSLRFHPGTGLGAARRTWCTSLTDAGEYPPETAGASESAHWGNVVALSTAQAAASPEPQPREAREAAAASDEEAALLALGFSKPFVQQMKDRSLQNVTTLEQELLHSGMVDHDAYYGAIARAFRLPFIGTIDPSSIQDIPNLDTQLITPKQVRINHRNRAPQVAIVPEIARLAEFSVLLLRLPELSRGLVITTPSAIRQAVWRAGSMRRVRQTVSDLFEREPRFSARIVATGWQGVLAGCLLTSVIAACLVNPALLLPLTHCLVSLVYLSALGLRIWACLRQYRTRPVAQERPEGPLPVYTVMVALYREAGMVAQLVANLERLDWPRALLDVKLVCEADDRETVEALKALKLPAHFEIVEVPPFHPRTKPKALTYALAGARGEFLAVYDAEDRPHPHQLMEACARFQVCEPHVACLQAPLIIANLSDTALSGVFAIEYAALFRGLLPMLARHEMPLPLGGTSNHFRTHVLREVGGWDPFNVTEDADLGLRLYRLGYRSQTLRCQTLEDAPVSLNVWTGQRTRWFKGWLQTWLVLTRNPVETAKQMGPRATLAFHLLIGGMLASALLHPLILLFIVLSIIRLATEPLSTLPGEVLALFALDCLNVIGSYLIFLQLGMGSMIGQERRRIGWRWLAVPMYWFMSSYAAWKALNELRTNPFFWKKTPHQASKIQGAPSAGG